MESERDGEQHLLMEAHHTINFSILLFEMLEREESSGISRFNSNSNDLLGDVSSLVIAAAGRPMRLRSSLESSDKKILLRGSTP